MRRLARSAARLLGLPVATVLMLLLRLSGRRAGVALVYHSLAPQSGDPETDLVAPHGVDLFEAQLRYLIRSFRIVDAAELPHAVAGRTRGERFPAAVTFDDDLASHVSLALSILRRAGVHATFFLTGATLRAPYEFWWQRLQRMVRADPQRLTELFAAVGDDPPTNPNAALVELARRVEVLEPAARDAFERELGEPDAGSGPSLPAQEVRRLIEAGMAVGFHTRRHYYLPSLEARTLERALAEGRAELEEVIGRRLTVVAYPHGVADTRTAQAAREAGFRAGFTGNPRAVCPEDDSVLLGRIEPSHRSVGEFALQLVNALLRVRGRCGHPPVP